MTLGFPEIELPVTKCYKAGKTMIKYPHFLLLITSDKLELQAKLTIQKCHRVILGYVQIRQLLTHIALGHIFTTPGLMT